VGRSLLILGAPGSGKTITLLELTRDLIQRAEPDPSQPIPVVFNLSSWAVKRQPLLDWLTNELRTKYRVPKRIGRSWLEKNWLLPMLDGLDEVRSEYRATCAEAINGFIDETGVPGMAVCSRLEEYTALPKRLKTGGAILSSTFESGTGRDHMWNAQARPLHLCVWHYNKTSCCGHRESKRRRRTAKGSKGTEDAGQRTGSRTRSPDGDQTPATPG
jgi:hypothetical protein